MWISLRPKATGPPDSCQRRRTWANIRNHLQGKPAVSFQLQIHSSFVSQEIFGMWDFKSPQENTPHCRLDCGGQRTRVGLSGHVS